MADPITEQDVLHTVEKIVHPVIQRGLMDLGIIKDIVLEGGSVTITLAFPFTGMPAEHIATREKIISSVREQVEKLGVAVRVIQKEMSQEELQAFLAKERETWNTFK